jgi:hypothetical protein
MAETPLRYDLWVEQALRQVIRRALAHVARSGLPGEHHFYLTFRTTASGVVLSDALRAQYPDEMTIVLQNQFWNLAIHDDGFEVALSFGGARTTLGIPFHAITAFADPGVNFGLQLKPFTPESEAGAVKGPITKNPPESAKASAGEKATDKAGRRSDSGEEPPPARAARVGTGASREKAGKAASDAKSGEVITLDAFRKK